MTLALPFLAALLAAPAAAPDANEVQILISGYELAANGAEKPAGVSFRTSGVTIGQPVVGVFSMLDCGYF